MHSKGNMHSKWWALPFIPSVFPRLTNIILHICVELLYLSAGITLPIFCVSFKSPPVALPKKLGSRWPHLDEPAGQTFALHHRGHGGQTVSFHQSTGDPCWGTAFLGWNDDAEAIMSATTHGSTPGVHHEADQEAKAEQEIFHKWKHIPLLAFGNEATDTKTNRVSYFC